MINFSQLLSTYLFSFNMSYMGNNTRRTLTNTIPINILIIENNCVERVNRAKAEGRRICAIGSTSMRAMENSVSTTNTLKPYGGWTNKFIFPKYDFRVADSLLTNFHTQQSTLLMLQSAFAGHEVMMEAYNEAIKEGYRFYAYGDAILIK